MARKSQASLQVVPSIEVMPRVAPPKGLTKTQRGIFLDVVNSLPADWFDAPTVPLLAEYARAVDMCNLLAAQVEAALAEGDPAVLKDVLKLRDQESRRAVSLATKMRLSQQATYDTSKARTKKKHADAKLWEFGSRAE